MIQPLVVANWKMNGTQAESAALSRAVMRSLRSGVTRAQVVLAAPFTALVPMARLVKKSTVQLAGQNCHWESSGAFTGEISATMLLDIDCQFVILGHSERRHIFYESDDMIARKLNQALSQGLRVILCVGETLSERKRGQALRVIARQLRIALKGLTKAAIKKVEIAYEPVWAIGTGQNATVEQIDSIHRHIRAMLKSRFGTRVAQPMRILYGGSVKPENAAMIAAIKDVNGLLVGGASLQAATFLPIVQSFGKK